MRYRFFKHVTVFGLILYSLNGQASLIESTVGTAVVNDATATYYNPSALTLVKNPQFIALGSMASFKTHFSGELTQTLTGVSRPGASRAHTNYFLPSFYLELPQTKNITVGFAIISNYFDKDISEDGVLRFFESGNSVTNVDLVTAVGIKLNKCFAVGASLNLTSVAFLLQPSAGFPNLDAPENKSQNKSNAVSWEGDIGVLLKPTDLTLIGFNYRNGVTYELNGTSKLQSNPVISSNDYRFNFWTPARIVLSINQNVNKALGFIGTLQYIRWNVFNEVTFQNIATIINGQPIILPNVSVPFHLHNTWLATVGTHYRMTPKWVIRLAVTYNQSPSNGHYQISTGDNYILGLSTSYNFYKSLTIDLGYAHAFIKNQNIHLMRNVFALNGINQATRDAFSVKLTFNG